MRDLDSALHESELRRRYDIARAARERTEALLRIAGELAGALDRQRVADGVSAEAARALGGRMVTVIDGGARRESGTAHGSGGLPLHVVTPIRVGGKSVGTLQLTAGFPDCATTDFLTESAAQAARALERIERFAKMTRLAGTDDLTGLPNRREWSTRVDRELARARRAGEPVAMAVLDLDRFKEYNDTHGNIAGDVVLKRVAAEWAGRLRPSDVLARIGGEEFALLAPGCGSDEAAILVERLRVTAPGPVTCSAGVAVWDGTESAEVLLERADRALYEAKYGGRDRLAVAPSA